jgi:hypothetical protein
VLPSALEVQPVGEAQLDRRAGDGQGLLSEEVGAGRWDGDLVMVEVAEVVAGTAALDLQA